MLFHSRLPVSFASAYSMKHSPWTKLYSPATRQYINENASTFVWALHSHINDTSLCSIVHPGGSGPLCTRWPAWLLKYHLDHRRDTCRHERIERDLTKSDGECSKDVKGTEVSCHGPWRMAGMMEGRGKVQGQTTRLHVKEGPWRGQKVSWLNQPKMWGGNEK